METAQRPFCLSLNPLIFQSPLLILNPPDSFPSNHQLNCSHYAPSNKVSMIIFSEETHKQDKHRHEVKEREREEKDESLDTGRLCGRKMQLQSSTWLH